MEMCHTIQRWRCGPSMQMRSQCTTYGTVVLHISDHLMMWLEKSGPSTVYPQWTYTHNHKHTPQMKPHTHKYKHSHWCWAICCTEVTPDPPPPSVWFQVKLDPSHLTFGAWLSAGWAERGKGTAVREGPQQGRLASDKGRNSIGAY